MSRTWSRLPPPDRRYPSIVKTGQPDVLVWPVFLYEDGKMSWTVRLTRAPKVFTWKSDYFPRQFAYKHQAYDLVKEVQKKGGRAVVVAAKVTKK